MWLHVMVINVSIFIVCTNTGADYFSLCVQLAPTLNGYITVTKTVTLPKKVSVLLMYHLIYL